MAREEGGKIAFARQTSEIRFPSKRLSHSLSSNCKLHPRLPHDFWLSLSLSSSLTLFAWRFALQMLARHAPLTPEDETERVRVREGMREGELRQQELRAALCPATCPADGMLIN